MTIRFIEANSRETVAEPREGEETLLDLAQRVGMPLEGTCEGQMACSTCHVVIADADAFHLGVLSSRIHVTYALAAGSWLGVGNDPVYAKSCCFDPFPFPECTEVQKAKIRQLAEELDAHRKRAQQQHGLGLTDIYNVLEKLRAASAAPSASAVGALSCNALTHFVATRSGNIGRALQVSAPTVAG